ncbi:MAG: hypothetical protein LGL72_14280, partial [Acidibrevibacterium sp.]|nr:hypothetical protein [Acidibrevibacterium fodinaquatile]
LREVGGIGAVRAQRIVAAWAEQKVIREIMVFLHSHGVGTARAVRIFKTYGADAIQGNKESLDLPERAHKALGALAEIRAMLEEAQVLAEDLTKPAASDQIAVTIGHFRELTRIDEHEIHEAVLSCTRARRQMLAAWPARRPTLH